MKDYCCSVCHSSPCICGSPPHPKHCHEHSKPCPEVPSPCPEVDSELPAQRSLPKGVFAAAGNGKIPLSVAPEAHVIFGAELYSFGEIVGHFENAADFAILKGGEYEIHYQLSAYNPSMEEGIKKPIDISANLVSSKQGVIDILHFTNEFEVIKKSILVRLEAGEVITLKILQPVQTEMSVHSEAIVFVRL